MIEKETILIINDILPGLEGVASSKYPYQPVRIIDRLIKNKWNDFIPIIYTPAWSVYEMSGKKIIIKKKNTVRSRIDMIILFSVIRCIK